MATFNKGILGGFSGKVGTVVGANWRGKDIMRSLPKPSLKEPTEKQLLQQARFKLAVAFLQPLKTILSQYFGSSSGVKSRVNLATSYTINEAMQVVAGIPELVHNKVLITKGELTGFQNAILNTQAGGVLDLEWEDNSAQGNASASDQVSLVSYCKELNDFQIFEDIVVRSDLMASVTLPNFCIGKTIEVWAFLNTEKQTFASNSFYLGEHRVL
ncbi:DUF6266 family protein [Epilithonimonas ginsengisoli]|uniref:DUF6266 family protein n=1 Tax=Epilithonimonas ginsengisoli TaxID=1245592 RepID=A0ABU4JFV4_9FLAO|nr:MULTISPECIES: DUF6266 family protein [Chryseobacterium group]MBV6879867.1 hypothetical protein [Epilithonimonas sp. FP105]MDW8548507.1 DUF6266 family protein [Epilithonimonas ginsengisoli]OAH75708.1 hypothetical protein AXA65_02485 [Chryseobacterium sp. FP211-J200]